MSYRNLNISLGVVNVPVGIDPLCDSSTRLSGKLVCPSDDTPLKQQLVCPQCGTVHTQAEAKTLHNGVTITPPESPESSKLIALDTFVNGIGLSEIDKSYSVTPSKGSEQGYAVLHAAIRQTGVVAIGTVVLDKAPRQVAVEATDSGLRMHYLRYAESFREENTVVEEPNPAHVALAVTLIETLKGKHERITDSYGQALTAAVTAAGGTTEKPAKATKDEPKDDLMAALTASVAAAKKPATKKARV